MNDIVTTRFVKGSNNFHYQRSWNAKEINVDFFAAKFSLNSAAGTPQTLPRGISSTKKAAIMKDIVHFFSPENRKQFWEDLPESENSEDLRSSVSDTGIIAKSNRPDKKKRSK